SSDLAEQVGMYLDSTANVSEGIENSDFEVGTAYLPVADGMDPHGVVVGGASLWITNQVDEEEQEAAWEFVKFMTDSEIQAEWAAGTGYFPITPSAYDEDVLKEVYDDLSLYNKAVDKIDNITEETAPQR